MDRPTTGKRWQRAEPRVAGLRSTIASRCVRLARPLAVALLVGASAALAADDSKIIFPSGNATTTAPAPTVGGAASSMTLILAVALAAVGGWLVWRNRRAGGFAHAGRNLNIEETRSLGNRQYLVVASYEGKKFLLGVCPGRIDMLSPLHGPTREGSDKL
jgi:flagellar protein FliO/FliZ